jgi:hypothetical protein
MLLILLRAFQNQRDCHWPAFKSGGRYAAAFQRELFIGNQFAGFQNRQDCPVPAFKSSRCNCETSVVQWEQKILTRRF